MQRCYLHSTNTCYKLLALHKHNLRRPPARTFTSSLTTAGKAVSGVHHRNKTNCVVVSKSLALSDKSQSHVQILCALLNGLEGSAQLSLKDLGHWSLKDYSQGIDKLIATIPPQKAIRVVERIVLSSLIPSRLRPQILASVSHSFLRHGRFAGALAAYKLFISHRFAPPISLIAAMYRASNARNAHKQAPTVLKDLALLSLDSLDVRSLALLLTILEKARRPAVMEKAVQDYAAQVSPSCLTNASVVASMIRGYHTAKELDGCYSWFYRFRNSLHTKDEFTPATPYVCLMTASRKLNPTNTKALYRIINTMREDNVPLITAAYNEILASELQNRNFQHVFSLCSAFQGSPATLHPDGHTFSLMFDALWKNQTGPKFDSSLRPRDLVRQMVSASESTKIPLTVFHTNAALRYFVHVGDFESAIFMVDSALSARVSPNTLTIRWPLEEILKRCQRAFDPSANLELENWVKLLLGGLTRDHFAHAAHLLDIVRSTRVNKESSKLTRTAQDALQLVHTTLISHRSLASSASGEELRETPVLLMIRDILSVCADLARQL